MSDTGIYLHIPFCRSRCSYCDFATGLYKSESASRYVDALTSEIEQCDLGEAPTVVDTIYFGGGTPSLLTPDQVQRLLTAVAKRFRIGEGAEVTIEMNPGSAGGGELGTKTQSNEALIETLREFRALGIDRVSFGAQTFDDRELARLGRSHDAADIRQTYQNLRNAGFENISFDLIAGLPGQTLKGWEQNLDEALQLRPEHLSFYLLEVHEATPLAEHIRRGVQPIPDDDLAAEMYQLMLERATAIGYVHYEISNLALPGFESRHNSKYWLGQPYFGFGCSAHSYDGGLRRWSNERDLDKYVKLVEQGISPIVEKQSLTDKERRAEALFLGLRMMRGISMDGNRRSHYGDIMRDHYEELECFREAGLIEMEGDLVRLTRAGALLSNEIFAVFV